MAFASLDDVNRLLRYTTGDNPARDAQLRASLDAVNSWADTKTWRISDDGSQCEIYFDVYEDGVLDLPADDVLVTKVKVYEYPSANGLPLSPTTLGLGAGYDVGNGRLYLRPVFDFSPFEGASAQRLRRTYSRVEVFYIGTGVVPRALTEGIAWLAAGHWKDGPSVLGGGVKSEKIGDYSYTVDSSSVDPATGEPAYVARAYWYLKHFMRTGRVSVV